MVSNNKICLQLIIVSYQLSSKCGLECCFSLHRLVRKCPSCSLLVRKHSANLKKSAAKLINSHSLHLMDSSDDERFHHFFEAESEDAMAPVHKLRNTDTSNADSSNLPKAFARPSSTQPPPLRSRLPEVAHDQDVLITMESQNMLLGSTPVASSPPLAPRSRVVPRATVGSSVSTALGGSTFIDPVQTTSGGGSEIDLEKYDN